MYSIHIEFTLNRPRKVKERERRKANEQQVGASNACVVGRREENERSYVETEKQKTGKPIIVGFGRNIRRSEMLSAM